MRFTRPLLIAAVFAAGWFVGASRSGTADAKPSASSSCRDDLGRTRTQLAAARAETAAERARADAAVQQTNELLAAERARIQRLEAATGPAATTLR
ncbi:MAG: hypothetical protein K8W52_45790 [Deltaproteobacteria bacterium]|nr:hypothetical protein [Deltaproteobacteria bacterium]